MKTKNVVKVSVNQLVEIMKTIMFNTYVGILSVTEPDMNKTGNPFWDKPNKRFTVKKVSHCSYRSSNYKVRVEKNMEREGIEGDFEPQKPSGRTRLEGTDCMYVSDKDPNQLYFGVERFDKSKPTVVYTDLNGNKLNETDLKILKSFINKPSENTSQPQEKKVSVICFKVQNIKEFTTNGITYQVV